MGRTQATSGPSPTLTGPPSSQREPGSGVSERTEPSFQIRHNGPSFAGDDREHGAGATAHAAYSARHDSRGRWTVTDFDAIDFFRDDDLLVDPYPYFEALRASARSWREPHHDVVMVTGYDEAMAVYNDAETFSSCTSVTGPFPGFPVPLEGDDVSELIEQHRDELPMSDQLPTLDPPVHTDHRALLMRLITPKRLKENEEFMWRLADRQLDTFLGAGRVRVHQRVRQPVRPARHRRPARRARGGPRAFAEALLRGTADTGPSAALSEDTIAHIAPRVPVPAVHRLRRGPPARAARRRAHRASPRRPSPTARCPRSSTSSGSPPTCSPPARRPRSGCSAPPSSSSPRTRSSSSCCGSERRPDPQLHRGDAADGEPGQGRLPAVAGADHRRGRRHPGRHHGDAASTRAANRDPRQFEDPATFDIDRENARHHLAFGRGIHTCPGAPLARAEARVSLERLLDRTADIRISEEHHGPAGARRYRYVPTFILRGLTRLHLEFTPAEPDAR